MTTQKIRELTKQLKEEVVREKAITTSTDLNARIERFILDKIEGFTNEILCLTTEIHRFTYNYYHPEVLKKFPEKAQEGEE